MSDLRINVGPRGEANTDENTQAPKRIHNPYLDSGNRGESERGAERLQSGIRQMQGRPLVSPIEEDPATEGRRGQIRPTSGASNKIQVHPRQEKNAVLRYVRNVPYETTAGLLADFVLSPKACAVFISLRYHLLYPHYLIQRVKELSRHFTLRVLLCHVDVEDCEKPLLEINKIAVLNDFTFVLAWSLQEAARYLETLKAYEQKSAESIQEKVDDDYLGKLQDCLGTVRSVNKSDVLTLASSFGSLKAVCDATASDLALCPGLGEKKVLRIHEALHEPLSRARAKKQSLDGR